jgi:dolichyl-phosphate beta-glucosyltransferase
MRSTAIVVPAFDEETRWRADAFREAAARDPQLRFVLVDDGSRDRTRRLLEAHHEEDPEAFRVVALPENAGKAEAVRRGVLAALEGPAEFVGYWDADLATPLEAVSEMRALLRARPDRILAMGARVQLLGREIRRRPLRHYLGRVFATGASWVLGLPVYDTQCGAKLFRASEEVRDLFREPFLTRWIFDVEILARLVRAAREGRLPPVDRIVVEHPLERWIDVAGSKVRPRDFLRAGGELWRIRSRVLGGRRARRAPPP